MSETLITELLRYCKTAFGVDLSPDSRARDLLTAELCLLKALIELGRAAMQRWCQQLGDGYVGARATRVRPVFHQRSERVDAHIFISLLAYHLLHAIERRLQENGDHRSWPTIRDLLSTHQMVTIVHRCTDGTVLRLRRPSQPELEQRKIYRTLRIPATPPARGRS